MARRMVLSVGALLAVSICTCSLHNAAAQTAPLFTGSQQITSLNGAVRDTSSGGCLDAPLPEPLDGGQWLLQQFPCNSGRNQFWSFVPAGQDPSGRDVVQIRSDFDIDFCFDLPGGSLASNTPVQLFGCNDGTNQLWVLYRVDPRFEQKIDPQTVTVRPFGDTNMCLDVANAVANAPAQIQIFPCKSNTDSTRTNQQWLPASLPQGMTGGVAHVNHNCHANLLAYVLAAGKEVGVLNCENALGCVANAVSTTSESIKSAQGTSFSTCGPPSAVFRSGSVSVYGREPVQTLELTTDGTEFKVHDALGWATQSDGDLGDNRNFGFYHQELTEAGGGVFDLAVSDKFKLPRGVACGFHHTKNTPPTSDRVHRADLSDPTNFVWQSTCMRKRIEDEGCPNGWDIKSHFDSRSQDAHFKWCEYQDPNNVCEFDLAYCHANARAAGFALGISSNVDPRGIEGGGTEVPPCPVGFSRVNFYDDGRALGKGLSWCYPLPDDLPQGLTAGMSYSHGGVRNSPLVVGKGQAMGIQTPFSASAPGGDGFAVRFDGDFGQPSGSGFYHQELVSGGTGDQTRSDQLKLLPGTTCGFHHTRNSPGWTCMDFDPAIPAPFPGNCPKGWVARSQFDMGSGHGLTCSNLQNQDPPLCAYFAWCEYQDPNHNCADEALGDCVEAARFYGYTVNLSSNAETFNGGSIASTTCPEENSGKDINCPCGWKQSPAFDAGRTRSGAGLGLAWCFPP
jgi:hypothetical protein